MKAVNWPSSKYPSVIESSHDICDYVAQAFNHGRLKLITSPEGTATANGKTLKFIVGLSGGSCASVAVKTKGCEDQDCDDEEALKSFHFPEDEFGVTELNIVPYHGMYYAVSEGPNAVFDPNTGPICSFEHHYDAVIVENKSQNLCKRYFNGQ